MSWWCWFWFWFWFWFWQWLPLRRRPGRRRRRQRSSANSWSSDGPSAANSSRVGSCRGDYPKAVRMVPGMVHCVAIVWLQATCCYIALLRWRCKNKTERKTMPLASTRAGGIGRRPKLCSGTRHRHYASGWAKQRRKYRNNASSLDNIILLAGRGIA